MSYSDRLRALAQERGRPVRIGLVGAGQMGRGFVAQVGRMAGMEVAVIADVVPGLAAQAFAAAGRVGVVETEDVTEATAAVAAGRPVAVGDGSTLAELPIDAIVEASGVPEVGARVAYAAILAGKDVGLLNVECDVTIGWVLATLARRTGAVYTVCRGDEPVEARILVDYVRDLGFEVVCAGKGKNNPLDTTATPAGLAAEAEAKGASPKMLASFVDGSKTMIEMAALANGADLQVARRGMTGPHCEIADLDATFRPVQDGGVLTASGVVDYCTGPVAPGVFAIGRCDDPTVVHEMEYLKMGPGPYYAFYRPYHLASIEAALSVAEAVLDRTASLAPVAWNAEVVAVAKRDLAAGEIVDGIGGTTVHGLTSDAASAAAEDLVPLGLAAGARVLRDVPRGTLLSRRDVAVDETTMIATLRRLQERMLAGAPAPVREAVLA